MKDLVRNLSCSTASQTEFRTSVLYFMGFNQRSLLLLRLALWRFSSCSVSAQVAVAEAKALLMLLASYPTNKRQAGSGRRARYILMCLELPGSFASLRFLRSRCSKPRAVLTCYGRRRKSSMLNRRRRSVQQRTTVAGTTFRSPTNFL